VFKISRILGLVSCIVAGSWAATKLLAQETATTDAARGDAAVEMETEVSERDILTDDQWREIQQASDRGLQWLADQQRNDGSFPCMDIGQPGVTSLCTLAFMSHGHSPGEGPYGETLQRAVSFVLDQQKENGLVTTLGPEGPLVRQGGGFPHDIGVAASYNHAISGLMLSESYGLSGGGDNEQRLRAAVEKAVEATLTQQKWPQPKPADRGGWRYQHSFAGTESDLPVTGWQLKLLRSAKNAGFDVPEQAVKDAVAYVLRCYHPGRQMFDYDATGNQGRSRAMAGVGILALAHSGVHNRPEAVKAADFILENGFEEYNRKKIYNPVNHSDRYHYGLFNCTMAMYQIGGKHWAKYFPPTVTTLLKNQNANGSWAAESNRDQMYGQAYTTSLVLLSLGAPNQLLPIYQR